MASSCRVTLDKFSPNHSFARQMLRGPVAEGLVRRAGRDVLARARSMYGATGYDMEVRTGSQRVHAFVYTADVHAMRSNLLHNTLSKALKR